MVSTSVILWLNITIGCAQTAWYGALHASRSCWHLTVPRHSTGTVTPKICNSESDDQIAYGEEVSRHPCKNLTQVSFHRCPAQGAVTKALKGLERATIHLTMASLHELDASVTLWMSTCLFRTQITGWLLWAYLRSLWGPPPPLTGSDGPKNATWCWTSKISPAYGAATRLWHFYTLPVQVSSLA